MNCELLVQRQRSPSFHEREYLCPHEVVALEGTCDCGVSNQKAAGLKIEVSVRLGQQESFGPRGRECQWV